MICFQLDKGIPEDQIRKSLRLDHELGVDIQFYFEFCIENNLILKDEESGKYNLTNYGREFISEFFARKLPLTGYGFLIYIEEKIST